MQAGSEDGRLSRCRAQSKGPPESRTCGVGCGLLRQERRAQRRGGEQETRVREMAEGMKESEGNKQEKDEEINEEIVRIFAPESRRPPPDYVIRLGQCPVWAWAVLTKHLSLSVQLCRWLGWTTKRSNNWREKEEESPLDNGGIFFGGVNPVVELGADRLM